MQEKPGDLQTGNQLKDLWNCHRLWIHVPIAVNLRASMLRAVHLSALLAGHLKSVNKDPRVGNVLKRGGTGPVKCHWVWMRILSREGAVMAFLTQHRTSEKRDRARNILQNERGGGGKQAEREREKRRKDKWICCVAIGLRASCKPLLLPWGTAQHSIYTQPLLHTHTTYRQLLTFAFLKIHTHREQLINLGPFWHFWGTGTHPPLFAFI